MVVSRTLEGSKAVMTTVVTAACSSGICRSVLSISRT